MSALRALRATVLALPLAACASAGAGRPSPLPHRFVIAVHADSARALVGAALTRERLPIDGGLSDVVSAVTSTFVVRKGGMGEAEVRLTLRLTAESPATSTGPGAILDVDATIRDLRRMLLMSPEDARSPRLGREPHAVQENDRETLGRIRALEDRLQQLGFERADVGSP